MSARALFAGAAAVGGAAYLYWRLYITALNSSGSQVQIMEVELRASLGGADLTTPSTTVTQSSYLDNGEEGAYPGSAAVDNDTTFSSWTTAPGAPPHWIRFQFATARAVAEFAIFASAGGGSVCPRDFKIQGSADGSAWTDVKSFSGIAAWSGWQAFNLN